MIVYFLAISLCILLVVLDIYCANNIKDKLLKWTAVVFLTFSLTRYIALIAFLFATSSQNLLSISSFIFATAVGITVPTAIAILYLYEKGTNTKIHGYKILLLMVPFIIFYLYFIFKAPKEILETSVGFKVEVLGEWKLSLAIVQTIVTTIFILLTSNLIKIIKKSDVRFRAIILDAALIAYIIFGALRLLVTVNLDFIYAELVGLFAIFMSFSTEN